MSQCARVNLQKLFNAWRRATSGHLELLGSEHASQRPPVVPIARGGLVHSASWDRLLEGVDTHMISVDEYPTRGYGNRRLMIALIQAASRRYRVEERALVQAPSEADDGPRDEPPIPAYLFPLEAALDPEPDEATSTQGRLFRRGRELLARGSYAQADLVLSAARDLRLDHAPTLACLARARLRNPERDADERVSDAVSMVRLACLLAPDDPDVVQARDVVLGRASFPRLRKAAEL